MTSNTAKEGCRALIAILTRHKVKHCVLCPGSRNAPLIVAAIRQANLGINVVIDERTAGFVALGIAQASCRPVALICTSGTALLNFAPAVAEAYYQQVPLIVISADRPAEWIDQDDSQTLRQYGALANITKRSYNLIAEPHDDTQRWWINREINDAIITATTPPLGPVHINMSIDTPIGTLIDVDPNESHRAIECIAPRPSITTSEVRWLATDLSAPHKVMIIAGFGAPDHRIDAALTKLAKCANIVVLTESIANIHAGGVIERIDTTLSAMSPQERMELTPDIVITFGGALVSRFVKDFLRNAPASMAHWQVGIKTTTVDCFRHLSRRIEVEPQEFLSQLATVMTRSKGQSDYAKRWTAIYERALDSHHRFIQEQGWCDLTAMSRIFTLIPRQWDIQLSNGTPIRYAQLMATSAPRRTINCNRGVSGIDGCTSTAIGASSVADTPTLLISGDTSFQYDLGALALQQLSPRMKMIVMCNGGGAIFHFIEATRHLPETSGYISPSVNLPLPQLCEAYGISYHHAGDMLKLEQTFKKFAAVNDRPALLGVYTDGILSAEVLRHYFKRK